MGRRKRNSRTLGKAELRLASVKSISQTLDVGEGLTVKDYTEKIEMVRQSLVVCQANFARLNLDINAP
ncbi:MAG: hypothetical protein RMZ42_05960, partial [Nostoc sp. DedQUE05]|nr:hypothetical protein [Nostoc sp. DedQUE05]